MWIFFAFVNNKNKQWLPLSGKTVGVLFSRGLNSSGKISSPRGIFVTFPRPKFKIRHFSPTKFTKLVTSTRLNCPNELVSFTSSKKDIVTRGLKAPISLI